MAEYIERTIETYERLRQKRYRIIIENGVTFELSFLPEYYHHLVGLHYLTDIQDISSLALGKKSFYRFEKNANCNNKLDTPW